MTNHDDGFFGADVADRYDESLPDMFEPAAIDPVVRFLAELAGDGAALELGVGTGRIALPLAERGVPTDGIELSRAMVAKLREKPGGDDIGVTIGDFATASAPQTYAVVYLVFNTIGNLTSQDAQVACFRNAARHLEPGGTFVVEVGTPALQRLPPGATVHSFDVSDDHLGFDEYDIPNQDLISHHFWRRGDHWVRNSVPFRYVWPAELDLMAQIAGMRLRERWADWNRAVFTRDSGKHISVWELVAEYPA
ncbi:MAG: class I SAM-dependent methyltransferase [Candidatus Limnocylindria bacterium]